MMVAQRRVGGDAVAEEFAGGGDKGFDRHGRFPAAESVMTGGGIAGGLNHATK
jgi:hypothetical protein